MIRFLLLYYFYFFLSHFRLFANDEGIPRGRGRPEGTGFNWDNYKELLFELYINRHYTVKMVQTYIITHYGHTASIRQYRRMFAKWNFSKQSTFYHDLNLLAIIKRCWHKNYSQKKIHRALVEFEGYPDISFWIVRRIRYKHHLFLGARTQATKFQAAQMALHHVEDQLLSGKSVRYGYRYSHANIRLLADCFIPRSMIVSAHLALDPQGVISRTNEFRHKRRRYMVKGPNRIWSVDGHDKLARFGFQIYGIIDAFSRNILHIYVGVSNRTQVAVRKMYLTAVELHGLPMCIRSDKGAETILMAQDQLALRRQQDAEVPFRRAYLYGDSPSNQRIERWWRTLLDGLTRSWVNHFKDLEANGSFDSSEYDITASRFLYMPIIRDHIYSFVDMHNAHTIRDQRDRDLYLPTGKPDEMYRYPPNDAPNYRTPPDSLLLRSFQNEVLDWDMHAYQTNDTENLCQQILIEGGFETSYRNVGDPQDRNHHKAYMYLRSKLHEHVVIKGNSLSLLTQPLGGQDWIEMHRNEINERWARLDCEIGNEQGNYSDNEQETEEEHTEQEIEENQEQNIDYENEGENEGGQLAADGLIFDTESFLQAYATFVP